MDTQQPKRGFNWSSLILGILFIIVALLSFQDPIGNLVAIVIVIGAFAIIKGLFEIFVRNRVKELTGYQSKMPIVIGVIDIIIGVFLLFNIGAGVITLPFLFAFWFLFDSILGLLTAGSARTFSNGYYWFTVVVNIIGILLGIYLLFNPLSSVLTLSFLVGAYFMLVGITEIIYAFR
ncbi:HdeD family acid-resistance protein [Enterococcus sp. AZ109]|uniref:HdeD family acid-resistance protein n=1 Tax=Enterococcus sp. AZ109 TaxID=2774634 RepID=UPI003F286529